jgi:hypothetical protein
MKQIAILLFLFTIFMERTFADVSELSECKERVEAAIKALNALYINHHLEPIQIQPDQLQFQRQPDPRLQHNIWRTYLGLGTFVDCLPVTGALKTIIRTDLINDSELYNSEPVPTWTPVQVAEEAKPWVQAFLGYFPKNLGTPVTQFGSDKRDAKRYYGGEWDILWPRVDAQGHRFERDDLVVNISEKLGLTLCGLHFDSTYQEATGKLISRDDALAAARAPAEALLAKALGELGSTLGSPKADLFIVNPNNIFQIDDMSHLVIDPNARLAWRVEYTLGGSQTFMPYHSVVVRIDAQTGKVLGGEL